MARLRTSILLSLLLLLALAATPACDSGDARSCWVHADCASGTCLSTGECAPVESDDTIAFDASDSPSDVFDTVDSPDDIAGDGADDVPADPTDDLPGDPTDDTPLAGCQPDHDAVVTAAEAPFAAGHAASFAVTTGVTGFSTTPTCDGPTCHWDLTAVTGDTETVLVETSPVAGQWFADEPAFASATYTAPLGEFEVGFLFFDVCSQTQLGVFEVTDDALQMLGIVSETEDGDTMLVYDPPLPVLLFPLAQGDSWKLDTHAVGPLCGSWVDYDISQTVTTTVDAAGSVTTPFGTFDGVLRVNSLLERHLGVGVLPTKVRTQTFVAECFTSIATITAVEGEQALDFDAVAEIRALAPFGP